MTTWITITMNDLYAYLAAPQIDALRRCVLAKNQSDPVAEVIADISLKIRATITSNKRNVLSRRPYALPPELKSEACILILEIAQTRIPGFKLTADQVRLADQARLQLQRVANGELNISIPDDRLTEGQKSIVVVHHRPPVTRGQSLKGF